MRTLILGKMPTDATPETHIASGLWCFVGQEYLFPFFQDVQNTPSGEPVPVFPLPDDPYPTPKVYTQAAKAANGEVLRLIRQFGKEFNIAHDAEYSDAYWEMALGPWLLLCVHMLAERQQRMIDLVNMYADEHIVVELLPRNCSFSFQNSLDFMVHGVQDRAFNQYVFSRILETIAPAHWTKKYLEPIQLHEATQIVKPRCTIQQCRHALKLWLRSLPFPRQKGFSLRQTFLLSLAVMQNKQTNSNNTIAFEAYADTPLQWHFPAERLIRHAMPKDLTDTSLPFPKQAKGKLRGMTAAISQDDTYRLELAAWREGGGKLFSIQHGANYGNLQSVGGIIFEYMQHAFMSWGWTEHDTIPVNPLPMPHPSLCAVYNKHKEVKESLILVGTEMSSYSYRLKTRPQAKDLLAYRRAKVAFIRTLAEPIQQHTLYRPYFSVASGLNDAPYVNQHLPQIHLCKGDLTAQMLRCRLLILDHYGTTLHVALAANVPTLCFWNTSQWSMDPASAKIVELLHTAGIFFHTPEEAAQHVNTHWSNIAAWWNTTNVQQARMTWLTHFANCSPATCKTDSHSSQTHPSTPTSDTFTIDSLTRLWSAALKRC